MYNRSKVLAIAVILLIPFAFLVAPTPQTKEIGLENPTFIISSWTYPSDEYGQGIAAIRPYENSSGAWVNFGGWVDYYDSTGFEINTTSAFKLKVLTTFNATLTGASSVAEGKNFLRHNVSVSIANGTVIFSQQNFTYIDGADEETGIYDYEYDVILNFISVRGMIYIVTITYEVYYPEVID